MFLLVRRHVGRASQDEFLLRRFALENCVPRIGRNLTYDRIGEMWISRPAQHTEPTRFSSELAMLILWFTKEGKLDEHSELYVIVLIFEKPYLYLRELCQELHEVAGVDVVPSTICRLLKSYGMTRKRLRQVALQRCDALCGAFMAHCSLLEPDMLV